MVVDSVTPVILLYFALLQARRGTYIGSEWHHDAFNAPNRFSYMRLHAQQGALYRARTARWIVSRLSAQPAILTDLDTDTLAKRGEGHVFSGHVFSVR